VPGNYGHDQCNGPYFALFHIVSGANGLKWLKCRRKKFIFAISSPDEFIGRPFVKGIALCYRTVVLSCMSIVLSVTYVYCGQMVEWIKMKRGVQAGLSPGHIVLDGDPAPPKRGHRERG